MSVKLMTTAMVVCAGLTVGATSASAADWWNPGTWFAPRPTYTYSSPAYRGNLAACPGGVCRPAYGGNCNNGVCTPVYRGPTYNRPAPVYAPNYQPAPSTWNSNYRGAPARRAPASPFYE